MSSMQSLVVAFLALCALVAALAEPRAQFVAADGDILLKLDYATHRGVYNKTNEVNNCGRLARALTVLGLHLSEHPICSSAPGRLKMGQAGTTSKGCGNSRPETSHSLHATPL